MSKHKFTDLRVPIEENNPAIVRNEDLCIKCGACRRVCDSEVVVGRLYDLESAGDCPICINCGQCANSCPTGSITERYEYPAVKKAIMDSSKVVIFSTSPSVRVGLGESFGLEPGTFVEGKMVAALRSLGANYVLDTNFGADLTIMEEATELVERVTKNTSPLPQFTSCCPAWVKFVETFYPDLRPHISSAKSPIGMQGATVKTYFAKQMGIDPAKIVNVAVTPCTAKKFEIRREEMNAASKEHNISGMRDTDHVITTRELAKWLEEDGIDFHSLQDSDYDKFMGEASGAGVIFGNTGGVMEAAVRTAYSLVTGQNLSDNRLDLQPVRNMDDIRSATVDIAGTPVRVAVAHGINNAKKIIEDVISGKCEYDFIEVMTCRGGCIGGGGQPKTEVPMSDKVRKARINALYDKDSNMSLRCSHDNPEIQSMYKTFYEKPGSALAERLLHTDYIDRSGDLGPEGMIDKSFVVPPKYRCAPCGYIHVGVLSEHFTCPVCGVSKDDFVGRKFGNKKGIMHCTKKITDDLIWVGANDRRLGIFESVYNVPNGVSYNSYLLLDEKTVLMDTVDRSVQDKFLENVDVTLAGRTLDYFVVQHMEPDHSAVTKQVLMQYPEATLVCNEKTLQYIKQFFDFDDDLRVQLVKEGDTLNTGKHLLHFVMAPMVHWPEVMVTYDSTDKILFSADGFGCFGALNGAIFADEVDFAKDYMDEARRYYTNIVGKYGPDVEALLAKASTLEINMICPLHGFVWRRDLGDIISKYVHWCTYEPEEQGVMIAYASVYGNTEQAAEILASRLRDKGVKTQMFDVSFTAGSDIVSACFKWSHFVFASTTYNSGIFVTMDALLNDLVAHNIQNRTVFAIENGTWSPFSGELILKKFENCKNIRFPKNMISITSSLKMEQLSEIDAMVEAIRDTLPTSAGGTISEYSVTIFNQ